ncbi:hypothetical protein FGG78_16540 [Thioclava sp. BHET1]|nr:hypothetical protein FGG78_16540 [Thioclava sp. BHET1]
MPLFYDDHQFGVIQARNGENRARIGHATGPGGPAAEYEHKSKSLSVPITLRYGLPDEKSYLTFKGVLNQKWDSDSPTASDPSLLTGAFGFQYFPNADSMISATLGSARLESESTAVKVERDSVDLRLDYLQKLNDNWGFAGRIVRSWGDSTLTLKIPGVVEKQSDDFTYAQAELSGNFVTQDLSFVPSGWALRPLFGISWQSGGLGDGTNNFGAPVAGTDEEFGSVWAKATLAKLAPPGKWAPFATLGVEHVYRDSNDAFIGEDTYGVLALGAAYQSKGGTNFVVTYDGRLGMNGRRNYNDVIVGAVYTF